MVFNYYLQRLKILSIIYFIILHLTFLELSSVIIILGLHKRNQGIIASLR
jgi:hypothetical protein